MGGEDFFRANFSQNEAYEPGKFWPIPNGSVKFKNIELHHVFSTLKVLIFASTNFRENLFSREFIFRDRDFWKFRGNLFSRISRI